MVLSERAIRATLAEHGIVPDRIDRNHAAPGEFVVWHGPGHPVYDLEEVRELAARLETSGPRRRSAAPPRI